MEKQEVAINDTIVIPGLTVTPVVQASVNYWSHNNGTSFFSIKEPVAVIVVSEAVKRAFRLTGEEVSIDQLLEENHALKEEILKRL